MHKREKENHFFFTYFLIKKSMSCWLLDIKWTIGETVSISQRKLLEPPHARSFSWARIPLI
jgi:hypothetical protein